MIVGALGLIAWRKRAQSPGLSRLAFLALVLIGAGIVNGANVPASLEESRINLYRWTWAVALVTFAALGLGIAALINWSARRSPMVRRVRPLGPTGVARGRGTPGDDGRVRFRTRRPQP